MKVRVISALFAGMVMVCWLATSSGRVAAANPSKPVDFNRDILPILSDNCFTCHGPDANRRMASLRLDTKEGIFADRGGYQVVVPKNSGGSKLYRKISSNDDSFRMPPPTANRKLSATQIELIKRWIDEGANYSQHWAYVAPQRPPVPEVQQKTWARNPIDNFVLARLESEGFYPSPEADRAALLRRVSFDLTGLPPTPAEVRTFAADKSANAYEKQVDRLLASPHYGENMARSWLDLARYADSHGSDIDSLQGMWPWRDWVIRAYNQNMPYDQFTIKQLAGDLLPNATQDDKVATGFNRNHIGGLSEFGERYPVDGEERANYVADRVSTAGTAWLGLTVGCARCHDHKYDPIKQKDFYRLAAYFNNVPEYSAGDVNGNAEPVIALPSPQQKAKLQDLNTKVSTLLAKILEPEMVKQENLWRQTALSNMPEGAKDGLVAYYQFEGNLADSSGHRHDATVQTDKVDYERGAIGKSVTFNGTTQIDFNNIADFDRGTPFALSVWVNPRGPGKQSFLQKRDGSENWRGFEIGFEDPIRSERLLRIVLRFSRHWPDDAIEIKSKKAVLYSTYLFVKNMGTPGRHIVVNYDGSGKASGFKLYLNGALVETEITRDHLTGSFKTPAPLAIGDGKLGRAFAGHIDEFRVYDRPLTDVEIVNLHEDTPARALIAELRDKPVKEMPVLREGERREESYITDEDASDEVVTAAWEERQQERLSDYFLSRVAAPDVREAYKEYKHLWRERAELQKDVPTTMVMDEMPKPMDTFILGRGQYYNKLEKVTPGVPGFLSHPGIEGPPNRLSLARWLVDPKNPLTARVEVNRYWQHYFGTGIVKTAEDFGSQGERPSHPELLDWLATEFVRTGWDIKAMQRLIVLSATYRQSSQSKPELRERDPENRLLARGPRVRLSAEEIRDNALAISGLLSEKIGGPSVYPYQPAGLWADASAESVPYTQSSGADLYRRSIYAIWRRSALVPSMAALDAPNRETCVARRNLTNTPLQALVLMNDPTYVEASRSLAQKAILQAGKDPAKRIAFIFRSAVDREPRSQERELVLQESQHALVYFKEHPEAARKLITVGESKPSRQVGVAELAAWTTVTRTVLNMDETITKE